MNNSDYETILIEREKIVRFLKLPEEINNMDINEVLYIVYYKAKAFLEYINNTKLKVGDSNLVSQIDINKDVVVENVITIYTNSYNFLCNTCKFLDLNLYGAAINVLKEVFEKVISLVESNIDVKEEELNLLEKSNFNDFYVLKDDLFIDYDDAEIEKDGKKSTIKEQNLTQLKEYFEENKNTLYNLLNDNSKHYTIIDSLEGESVINVTYGEITIIIVRDEKNKTEFDKIVKELVSLTSN